MITRNATQALAEFQRLRALGFSEDHITVSWKRNRFLVEAVSGEQLEFEGITEEEQSESWESD